MLLSLLSPPQSQSVSQEFWATKVWSLNCPPKAFIEINWALELGLQTSVLERDIKFCLLWFLLLNHSANLIWTDHAGLVLTDWIKSHECLQKERKKRKDRTRKINSDWVLNTKTIPTIFHTVYVVENKLSTFPLLNWKAREIRYGNKR